MNLDRERVKAEVAVALAEDLGSGDCSAALLPATQRAEAFIISRESLVLCGQAWVEEAFWQLDPSIEIHWLLQEGAYLETPGPLCQIRGNTRSILSAERTALNFLQSLSGTATLSRRYLQKITAYKTQLLDTRKTIPGLRYAQKYAVSCAGGSNHRFGLYDAYLLKENHIKAAGSIQKALQAARAANSRLFLEIEVETLDQLKEALAARPDRILLDNFSLSQIEAAVLLAAAENIPLEASGGIDLATIENYAKTGVDFISIGALTKSLTAIDLSLRIKELL